MKPQITESVVSVVRGFCRYLSQRLFGKRYNILTKLEKDFVV